MLEQRIAAVLEQHRPQLAELVHQAVDRELQALVAAELQRCNGTTPSAIRNGTRARPSGQPDTRLCRTCGQAKPRDGFEAGRAVCRGCRRAQHRERQRHHKEATAAPFPGAASPSSPAGIPATLSST